VTDEQQIAALRDEIRRAGRTVGSLRWGTALCTGVVIAVLFHAGALRLLLRHGLSWGLFGVAILVLVPAISLGAMVGCFIAFPSAEAQFYVYRHRLRRRLSLLPTATVVEVLDKSGTASNEDAAALARVLRSDLGVGAEIAPAAPNARGDEASPAELQP
jgi:hypothetical protein